MSKLIIGARAPSNIALIKYMGKKDSSLNLPENPSLSLTLNSLCSIAECTIESGLEAIRWIPELPIQSSALSGASAWVVPQLEEKGIQKVISHFERVKDSIQDILPRYGLAPDENIKNKGLTLRTANSFPASSGIASSASSFAAMTLGMAAAFSKDPFQFQEVWAKEPALKRDLASISRRGSGSSCRSFEGPWIFWENDLSSPILVSDQLPELAHFVILVKIEPKKISSSDAHLAVKTSPLWENRVHRVGLRINQFIQGLQLGDFNALSRLAWSEAWEMHSLFHTAEDPFSYWEPGTMKGLQWFADQMKAKSKWNDFIVTLDAGPNIHVLVKKAERERWRNQLRSQFKEFDILEDEQGKGASFIESHK